MTAPALVASDVHPAAAQNPVFRVAARPPLSGAGVLLPVPVLRAVTDCKVCGADDGIGSPIHYRGSHNHLLQNVIPKGPAPADAELLDGVIVVPTSRSLRDRLPGIQLALDLGREFHMRVVVVCSGAARAAEFPFGLYGRVNQRLAVIDLEAVDSSWKPQLPSFDHKLSHLYRMADQGIKRNLGLALAVFFRVEFALFIDDDVEPDHFPAPCLTRSPTLDPDGLRHAVRAMRETLALGAIGWSSRDESDNSVVGHARKLTRHVQDVFIGGSALLVRVNGGTIALPSFPVIYNEDWLFLLSMLERQGRFSVGLAGTVRQMPKNIFQVHRACSEEAGDLVAEILMNLWDDLKENYLKDVGAHFWRHAQDSWALMLETLRVNLRNVPAPAYDFVKDGPGFSPAKVIEAAAAAVNTFSPYDLADFVYLWKDDYPEWRGFLSKVPRLLLAGELEAVANI